MNEQKLYQYLGANVYRLRKQRGLTQSELAAYIGCNQKYISQIETGAAKASVSICYKIANTFSVSVDSLFTDPEKCVNAGENTSDREFAESITRTIIQFQKNNQHQASWQLLRYSGLSEERLTDEALKFLNQMKRIYHG